MENIIKKEINIEKFMKICRSCLNECNVTVTQLENNFIDILKEIVNIQIDLNDELPQQICQDCSSKVKDISMFIESVKANDAYLRKTLEWNKQKPNESENIDLNVSDDCYENNSDQKSELLNFGKKVYKKTKVSKQVKKKDLLEKINNAHRKAVPYECEICLKTFMHSPNLRRHINIVHKGIKPFKCEECGKEFATFLRITEHLRVHTGERPYVCNYCGSSFKKYSTYYAHDMRHKIKNGEREKTEKTAKSYPRKRPENPLDLKCEVCLKMYSSKQALVNHMKIHSGEKTFLCTVCGKEFMQKDHLQVHSRIHTGEKPLSCKDCGKNFRQPAAHRNHLLMHKNERSFKCEMCNKSFIQVGHLKSHLKTHTGEKPYKCSFCGKAFTQNGNLRAHTRIHTNERPYKCTICLLQFYDSSSLKKHKKTHNNMENSTCTENN